MNKNYVFASVGIAAVIVIILVAALSSSTVAIMTLDGIIKNNDCNVDEMERRTMHLAKYLANNTVNFL